ncbi:unnamed protein product [Larinioides sclopetarius]|uniref:Uncharacterized protein n=1 Tax=Larinioides sclopetarius TaxID=280406 RepID=A0AAV1YZW3_9ARAC
MHVNQYRATWLACQQIAKMDDFKTLFGFFQGCSFTYVERRLIAELNPIIKKTIEDFTSQKPCAVLERNFWSRKNPKNHGPFGKDWITSQIYKRKIDRIIRILGSSDEKEEEFVKIFPIWKRHRDKTIRKLLEIIWSLKDIRRKSNIVKIVTGTVGIAGGALTIGSLLLPIAAVPGWLVATASSLLPSVFLPAAPVASTLSVVGGVAAAGGAVGNVGAGVAELVLTQKSLDEAKEVIAKEQELLKRLGVFEFLDELNDAIDDLFCKSTSSQILKDLTDFLGKVSQTLDTVQPLKPVITKCVVKMLPRISKFLDVGYPLASVILSILFVVLMIRRRGCAILNYSVALGLVSAVDASVQITRLIAAASLKDSKLGELIPRELAGKIAIGAIAGVGIALDVMTVVLNGIELAEGSLSDEVKMMSVTIDHLKNQLKLYEDLNNELQRRVKRRLRKRWILRCILLVTLASILTTSLYIEISE